MKKNDNRHLLQPATNRFTKLLLIMKLISLLLFIACMQGYATGFSQPNITLNLKNADLPEIFAAIQKKPVLPFYIMTTCCLLIKNLM